MAGLLKGAITKRIAGERASPFMAVLVALVVGVAVAVLTYREGEAPDGTGYGESLKMGRQVSLDVALSRSLGTR